MAGNHHSPAAAAAANLQSAQNDVTPATHNQHSGTLHRRRNNRKIETLINAVNFIPFIPKLLIFHEQQETVLKRLGLYNFSKIKLDQTIRSDLIAQVIANYDPKKRCSFVNGKRVRVSRADLARALALPVGKQGVNNINGNVFSDEEIEFVDDFVFNWMLIHEESWVMPEKIVRMTRCVRDGHPEKLDSASLIWCKVERELGLGVKLVDCYYASHLQRLIRSQCEQVFEVNDEVKERIEKVSDADLTLELDPDAELTLGDAAMGEQVDLNDNMREQTLQLCQTIGLNNNEEAKVGDVVDEQIVQVADDEVKEDEDDGLRIEKVTVVQEDDAELTLGDATMGEQVDLNNNLGEQLLQHCQTSDLNNYEEAKIGDAVDEPIVQVEDDEAKEDGECIEKASVVQEDDAKLTLGDATMDEKVDLNNNLREQLLQRCQTIGLNNNEEAKVEDAVDEQVVEVEADEIKEDGEHIKEVSVVQEDGVQLSLGHETVDSTNNLGEQLLQLCQTCDLNDNNNNKNNNNNSEETVEVEDVVDEHVVEVEDEDEHIVQEDDVQLTLSHNAELTFGHKSVDELMDSKNDSAEQFLQHSQTSDLNNEVKVDDVVDEQTVKVDDGNDDGEKFVEGLDMEANDDAIDLVGSRGDSFMSHGGPSFFNNNNNNDNNNNSYNNDNGKRVMESEDDTGYLDMNNKRLKTADVWDHNQSQFGLCMVQMDQWIQKAKMITDSKQQIYANQKYHQDLAMNEVQGRQQAMEMIIKSKDEELGKKHAEVYRLERELFLMGDLLSGYRKALNDERIKFSEYRKRAGCGTG